MEDYFDKCISLFYSLLILMNAYFIRKAFGTWLLPACIYALFWFGYTFFPLLFAFNVPCEPLAVGYILLSTIAFSLSTFAFDWKIALKNNRVKLGTHDMIFDNPFLKKTFYVCSSLSLVFLFINSLLQGISLHNLVFNLFESAAEYTEKRYAAEVVNNIFGQLSLILTYISIPIGGILYNNTKTPAGKVTLVTLSFIPSIFVMVTQTSKGLLFLAIVYFFAGILISRIYKNELVLFTKGSFKTAAIALIFIIPALIVSFISRGLYGYNTDFVIQRLLINISSYSFGHMYAFSDWFSFYIGGHSILNYKIEYMSFGFYTFMSIFKLFGSTKIVPQGVFDDYYNYRDLLETNIFTHYRGLILDFGIVGSLVFIFLVGILLHFAFSQLLNKRNDIVAISIFISMMGYFYTSFIISIFIWNSVYASCILLIVIFFINKRKIKYEK